MTLPVAILAGGLGTRLGEKTLNKAKVLIDVAGKPFISRQLNYLSDQGIKDIVICVGHLGNQIKNYIGNGSKYNLNVSYSDDSDQLLGTGGSIKKACQILGEHFFILYGDSFLPVNFSLIEKAYFQEKKPALMTVLKNKGRWDKSNAYFKDKCVRYNKKKTSKKHGLYRLWFEYSKKFNFFRFSFK